MIPVLYPATETAFTTNGLGGLPDAISCVVTEQRNTQGGYYLEMEYPVDGLHFDLLAPERIIYAAPSMGNTPQPFRISRITRPINGIVHIEAPHISAQMQTIMTYGTYTARSFTGVTYDFAQAARDIGQDFPFWFSSDKTFTEGSISFPEPTPFMNVLLGAEGSILDTYGGEYEWNGREVILHDQRGVDSGLEIRYGVNMSDLEAETDATELVTACVPFWKGQVNEQDVIVVGDMCEADNADAYAYVRCVPLDVTEQFELEQDEQPSVAQVTAKGQAFVNSTSRKLLQTSIRVSYEPTTSGIGERRINLCDTVRVVYPDLAVSSISKVVETRFNTLTERYDELTIGTIRNNIVDTIAGLISGGAISYSGGSSSGGGGSSVGAVLYNMPQNLNEAQKAQARANIGAAAVGGASYYVLAEDIGLTTEWPTVPADATAEEQEAIAEQKAEIAAANSAALNQFIASSAAAKTIRFGAGTYHFGATIRITTQTSLVGNGRETVLKFSGTDLFLDSTVYYAPHFYDLILSGVGYGTCLKIGTRAAGSDRSKDVTSARGIFFDVRVEHFDYGMRFESGWGWSFYSLDALDIRQYLFHGVGVWNTCNIIGGEYEYQAKGGVLWDDGCTCNAVNFIGVIWESLESHVFAVSPRAGNVNATIHGCYFENKYDYENRTASAHLIHSPNEKATFCFEGYTSIGYNQVIYSKGLVRNPPQNALLALGAFHQALDVPTSRFSAVQSPSYVFPHGEVIDLDQDFEADTLLSPASDLFPIDARGLHFQALNASFVTHKEQFAAGTPVRQLRLRIPEGLFDLSTVDIGFEIDMPDGVDLESGMSIYCRVMGSQTFASVSSVSGKNPAEEGWYEKDAADNYVLSEDTAPVSGKTYYTLNSWSSSQELALNRYVPMLGSDVIGVWRKFQVFKRYRSAVTAPSVTINGRKYYEIQMSVNAAEVGISKVFIDDGKRYHVPRSLYDAELKAMQTRLDAVEEMASPFRVLEYLESDGASWIDTGVLPSEDLQLRVQFQLASPESSTLAERQYVFGAFARDASNNVESRFQFYYGGSQLVDSTNIFVGWGSGARGVGYQYLFPKASDATLRVANMDAGTFYLSGTARAKFENPVFTTPVPIFLFACNENGTPNRFSNGMRITKARFFRDGELIADYVPRLRKADDMAGMLDLVSGTFHANRGTGTFLHD